MLIAGLVLFSSALLQVKPAPIFADVSFGAEGPYRFLVDTGSQTSLIDVQLAARLKLQPRFRVEVVTQHATRLLPALKLNTLHIGGRRLAEAEFVIQDLSEARRLDPAVQGVLGLNALAGLNFTLVPAAGKLELDSTRPAGDVVPFDRVEDRIAIKGRMGSETLTLIVDSGATNIVLFRTPRAMVKTPPVPAAFATLDGVRTVVPTTWSADLLFGPRLKVGSLPAAIVTRPSTSVDGLLPASVFKAIHIDQARGEVVLVR